MTCTRLTGGDAEPQGDQVMAARIPAQPGGCPAQALGSFVTYCHHASPSWAPRQTETFFRQGLSFPDLYLLLPDPCLLLNKYCEGEADSMDKLHTM